MASSASAIRHSEPPHAYVTVAEAASMTGLTARSWTRRAQRESSHGLAHLAPPPGGRGKQVWWVSRTLDSRLLPLPSGEGRGEGTSLSAKHPAHLADAANRRLRWLDRWQALIDDPPSHLLTFSPSSSRTTKALAALVVAEAKRVEGDDYKISVRSLQAWKALHVAKGIDGLVPRFGSPPGSPHRARSNQAVDFFYSLYHTQSRLSVALCHEITLRRAREEALSWPEGVSATRRWLRDHDDIGVSFLMREGSSAFSKKFMRYNEIDYALIQPGELFVCDHHQADFWVSHGYEQIRPWLTAIQDCRSRVIVGWHLGVTPNQNAIVAAMRIAFRDRAIPSHMRIDNGKDFTSKRITGLTKADRRALKKQLGNEQWDLAVRRDRSMMDIATNDSRWLGISGELGIKLIYAIPYAAWSKGTLERWFGTFESQHGKTYATYCGNSALTKPECLEAIRHGYGVQQKRALRKQYGRDWRKVAALKFVDLSDVPTLDDARAMVGDYLDIYHRSPHSGKDVAGRTPEKVWATATTLRRVADNELMCLLNVRGAYKVGPNGVSLIIGGKSLSYGAKAQALRPWVGREVLAVVDPVDTSYCWAFTPDAAKRRPICRLESNDGIHPLTSEDEIAEVMRSRKNMHRSGRSAAGRTRTAVQEIKTHHRKKAEALRATGTDHTVANIAPVQTGFEVGPNVAREEVRYRTSKSQEKSRDLLAAAAALQRPTLPDPEQEPKRRWSLDALAGQGVNIQPPDGGDEEPRGTDARLSSTELLKLIGVRP